MRTCTIKKEGFCLSFFGADSGTRFAFSALRQKIKVATSVCTGGRNCPPDSSSAMGSRPSPTKNKSHSECIIHYGIYWHTLHNLIQCNAVAWSVAFVKRLNYGICISITTKSHIIIPTIMFITDKTITKALC